MMALGLVIKNKPLKGSCGGVATLMGNENCEICGGDPNKCAETPEQKMDEATFYKAKSSILRPHLLAVFFITVRSPF